MYVVTATSCLKESTIEYVLHEETSIRTALGNIVVIEITKEGLVLLAGPPSKNTMKTLQNRIDALEKSFSRPSEETINDDDWVRGLEEAIEESIRLGDVSPDGVVTSGLPPGYRRSIACLWGALVDMFGVENDFLNIVP